MDDVFEKRIGAAAAAAWRTVLVGIVLLMIQWGMYLIFTASQPAWLRRLWGPDMSWPFVKTVWFWAAAGIKAFLWILALLALWLTLWAKQLRKVNRG